MEKFNNGNLNSVYGTFSPQEEPEEPLSSWRLNIINSVHARKDNEAIKRGSRVFTLGVVGMLACGLSAYFLADLHSEDKEKVKAIIVGACLLSYVIARLTCASLSGYVPDLFNVRHYRDYGCRSSATPFTEQAYQQRIIRRKVLIAELFIYFLAAMATGITFGLQFIKDKADPDTATAYRAGLAVGASILSATVLCLVFGRYVGLRDCLRLENFIHAISKNEQAQISSNSDKSLLLQTMTAGQENRSPVKTEPEAMPQL